MIKPAAVSTWAAPQKYFRYFIDSARRRGIEPQNADPNQWPGTDWRDIEWFRKSEAQARFVREHLEEYTHVMFTDSYDVVFAAGWDEIMSKFLSFDSPIVLGCECNPWPPGTDPNAYPPTPHRCRYLNAGFWMGEIKAVLPFITELENRAKRRDRCDQGIFVDLFLSGQFPIKLDTACSLLFCCNMDSLNYLEWNGTRWQTKDTGQTPCVFHGNGASPLDKVIEKL